MHADADVDARAKRGTTALMSAAKLNFPAAVRELLEGKPDVGAEDVDGHSALHHAVRWGLTEGFGPRMSEALDTIRLLLDNGADPNQQGAGGSHPPLFAGRYRIGVARQEPPGAGPKTFYPGDRTPDGSQWPMASIAPLLITKGADPNIYLDHPRDRGHSLAAQVIDLQGHSLAVTAFYEGEFDSLDSLVASGTLVPYHDYRLMMRSLNDPYIRSRGSEKAAVQSLFRVLKSPSLQLGRPDDKKNIMDAWTQLFRHARRSRPKLARIIAPHLSVTGK